MNLNGTDGFDLDQLLESELRDKVGGLNGPASRVGQSRYHAAFIKRANMTPLAKLAAMATSRGAAGLAVATLAVGGGSVAAAAATGSANPAVWGKTVSAAVADCKDRLTDGSHGIGQCVSKVARQQGAAERAEGPAGKADQAAGTHHPTGKPSGHPDATDPSEGARTSHPGSGKHPNGSPSSHPGSTDHPEGPPSPRPNPSDHPGGRSTAVPSH